MSDCPIVITGAGIGGLVLALSLKKHCGVPAKDIEVYEQAPAFGDNVGGAMGLYANGLRVLRDVSPDLLATVREAGYDYIYRRWQRHDGSVRVACAREAELTDDPDLQSIGIRRWKLQKALCDASAAAGIVIHFGKRADKVEPKADGTGSVLTFLDGTTRTAKIVFGADGLRSKTREAVVGSLAAEFTGVTCLMGAAKSRAPSAASASLPLARRRTTAASTRPATRSRSSSSTSRRALWRRRGAHYRQRRAGRAVWSSPASWRRMDGITSSWSRCGKRRRSSR